MAEKQRTAVPGTLKITLTPARAETGRIRHYWLRIESEGVSYSRRVPYLHSFTRADAIILAGAIEGEIASWLPF